MNVGRCYAISRVLLLVSCRVLLVLTILIEAWCDAGGRGLPGVGTGLARERRSPLGGKGWREGGVMRARHSSDQSVRAEYPTPQDLLRAATRKACISRECMEALAPPLLTQHWPVIGRVITAANWSKNL